MFSCHRTGPTGLFTARAVNKPPRPPRSKHSTLLSSRRYARMVKELNLERRDPGSSPQRGQKRHSKGPRQYFRPPDRRKEHTTRRRASSILDGCPVNLTEWPVNWTERPVNWTSSKLDLDFLRFCGILEDFRELATPGLEPWSSAWQASASSLDHRGNLARSRTC